MYIKDGVITKKVVKYTGFGTYLLASCIMYLASCIMYHVSCIIIYSHQPSTGNSFSEEQDWEGGSCLELNNAFLTTHHAQLKWNLCTMSDSERDRIAMPSSSSSSSAAAASSSSSPSSSSAAASSPSSVAGRGSGKPQAPSEPPPEWWPGKDDKKDTAAGTSSASGIAAEVFTPIVKCGAQGGGPGGGPVSDQVSAASSSLYGHHRKLATETVTSIVNSGLEPHATLVDSIMIAALPKDVTIM